MSANRRTRLLASVLAAVLVLAAGLVVVTAGAATKPKGDVVNGKALFKKNCGTCHRLAAAKSHGNVGPNLNGARIDYSVATWVITNGLSLMPGYKGQLKQAQIRDLAAFVTAATKS